MKTYFKRMTATIFVVVLSFVLVSCNMGEESPSNLSDTPVSNAIASKSFEADTQMEPDEATSNFSSTLSEEQKPTPAQETEYGTLDNFSLQSDCCIAFYSKTNPDETHDCTVCAFDRNTCQYTVLNVSPNIADEETLSRVLDFGFKSHDIFYYFYSSVEDGIGYYHIPSGKFGNLPLEDPSLAFKIIVTGQGQGDRFGIGVWVLDNSIFWAQTDFDTQHDKIFMFNIETNERTLVFESPENMWVADSQAYKNVWLITTFRNFQEGWPFEEDTIDYTGKTYVYYDGVLREYDEGSWYEYNNQTHKLTIKDKNGTEVWSLAEVTY